MSDNKKDQTIQAVTTAIEVLEVIAAHGRAMRPVEIARKLRMTLPRVSRHLRTLEKSGLITTGGQHDGYSLGWKLMQLGKAATNQNQLVELATPYLQRLNDATQETVVLAVPAGADAVVLQCLEATWAATITLRLGQKLRFPLSPTARLIHSFKEGYERDEDREEISPELITSFESPQGSLEDRIALNRRRMYDYDLNPHGTGFSAVAAPVFEDRDSVVAAVAIILPMTRMPGAPPPELLDHLFRCAAAISYRLGSTDMWASHLKETAA